MRRSQPKIHRLLRALIACWALLLVFEPPVAASASGELRTLSAWLLPGGARPAVPLSAQARAGLSSSGRSRAPRASAQGMPRGAPAPMALPFQVRRAQGVGESLRPLLDGRYLYLEVQSLLC